jgi:hypothetical protein
MRVNQTILQQPAWMGMVVLISLWISASGANAESTVQLAAPFTSRGSGVAETSLGDLVADAVRRAADSQVALVDAEALQAIELPKGPVPLSRMLGVLQVASEPLVVLTVKGSVLVLALERGVSNLPKSNPGFLQISGLTFTLKSSARAGARTGNIFTTGSTALDRLASYKVAMPRSLADGANGFFLIWPGTAPSRTLDLKMGDAVRSYVSDGRILTPASPRITR